MKPLNMFLEKFQFLEHCGEAPMVDPRAGGGSRRTNEDFGECCCPSLCKPCCRNSSQRGGNVIDPFSENQINSCQKVSQLAMDVPVVCHNRAESIWLRNRCWISDRAILLNFWTIPMVSAGRVFFLERTGIHYLL